MRWWSGGVWAHRAGLALPLFRALERLRAADPRVRRRNAAARGSAGELPVPPGRLIVRVAGVPDVAWFLQGGELAAETIRNTLASVGYSVDEVGAVLDFGCGCGRVTRHWASVPGLRVSGCDPDGDLIAWCCRHLPGEYVHSGHRPPLPWPDGAFGLVYALSVVTHLTADDQRAWMAELRRVARPGGLLLITTQGDTYRDQLAPAERERYDRGELIVRWSSAAGTNLCAAFHPPSWVRADLARSLEVLRHQPAGALGNPHQDIWLLRLPQASGATIG